MAVALVTSGISALAVMPHGSALAADGRGFTSAGYGIMQDGATPASPADPDSMPVELGVEFSSKVDGWISGIRYYKLAQTAGSSRATLWAADGSVLARVQFDPATASGWQTAALDRPVAITQGTEYVASYTAPRGRYADDQDALGGGRQISNRGLTATRGVYSDDLSFPTDTWNDSNYFADVVFVERAKTGDSSTPESSAPPMDSTSPSSSSLSTSSSQPEASDSVTIGSTKPSGTEPTATPSPTTASTSIPDPPTVVSPSPVTTPLPSPTRSTSSPSSASPSSTSTTPSPTSSPQPSVPSTSATPTSTPPTTTTIVRTTPPTSSASSTSSSATSVPAPGSKPGTDNTGVPTGVTLTPSGSLTITKANQVVSGLDINGAVVVDAPGVVIKNSRIHGSDSNGIYVRSGSATIADSEISGFENAIVGDNWSALRVDIHGTYGDGVKFGDNVLLQDSWIHDLTPAAGAHSDGGQMQSGVVNLVIRHNVIDMSTTADANSALFLAPDQGPSAVGPVLISNNWLNGGNYTVFCVDGNNGQYIESNISFLGNRFGHAGQYGPSRVNVPIIALGNVWDDTGVAMSLS